MIKCILEVKGGTVTGEVFAISGNGTYDNTSISISGGSINSNNLAIYYPQEGDLTISGGTITAPNGIQYCGTGNIAITGGVIHATGEYTQFPQKQTQILQPILLWAGMQRKTVLRLLSIIRTQMLYI